jgi:hypothetical protein
MKVYLAPNISSVYDFSQLNALAAGFDEIGITSHVFKKPLQKHPHDLSKDINEFPGERQIYKEMNVDVLLEVNRFRSRHLRNDTRHISWFQDVRPSEYKKIARYAKEKRQNDIIYLLGSAQHFGLDPINKNINCLLSGVSAKLIRWGEAKSEPERNRYDINLLGYFSGIKERLVSGTTRARLPFLLSELVKRPKSLLKLLLQLTSDYNINRFYYDPYYIDLEKFIEDSYAPLNGYLFSPNINKVGNVIDEKIYDFLYTELPRKMDREILHKLLQEQYYLGKKVIAAGQNWKSGFPGSPFVKDHVIDPNSVFSASAITVHNNTHGLGIHSRTLDCMASGGFVFMHPSPHSRLPGGMDSTFEPEVNYGLYSADNFVEKAEKWLEDEDRRKKAIAECKKILLSKHLWKHRAEQILGDLKSD